MMMANSQESMNTIHLTYPPDDDDGDDDVVDEFVAGSRMLSRLSIESCNAAAEDDAEEPSTKISKANKGLPASLPGTPDRLARRRGVGWDKEYASESEGRSVGWRERWVEKEWERRRRWRRPGRSDEGGAEGGCRLLVRPMGPDSSCICMDMMEVKACRDLGLEIPRDWTVELPGGVSAVDSSSGGGGSPIATWTVSSPGDDPEEIKARLKVWAQAVALASASQISR